MEIVDLGTLAYREAWRLQEQAHEQVGAGGAEKLFFVEHPPVVTLGRRPGVIEHLLVSEEGLNDKQVELVQSDRGGDITLHGPGQLVAYPIIKLANHRLSVSGYVHSLEKAVIAALNDWGVKAEADPKAVGVWTSEAGMRAKICAVGVRIRQGVSLHGLALNVSTDLRLFDLIVPCGLDNRNVTSLQRLLGHRAPSMDAAKQALACRLQETLGESSNES